MLQSFVNVEIIIIIHEHASISIPPLKCLPYSAHTHTHTHTHTQTLQNSNLRKRIIGNVNLNFMDFDFPTLIFKAKKKPLGIILAFLNIDV